MGRIFIATTYSVDHINNDIEALSATLTGEKTSIEYYHSWKAVVSNHPEFKVITECDDDFAGCLYKKTSGKLISKDRVVKVTTAPIK